MNIERFKWDEFQIQVLQSEGSKEYAINGMVLCECDQHAISLFSDEQYFTDLSFWKKGSLAVKYNWFARFYLIWQIITKGRVYADMVSLSNESTEKMVNFFRIDKLLKVMFSVVEPSNEIEQRCLRIFTIESEMSDNLQKPIIHSLEFAKESNYIQ